MKSPVTSITDEQLEIIEALADAAVANPGEFEDSDEEFELMSQIRPMSISGLIARLRAAEADAKRYRKWTGLMFVEPSKLARALASCESIDDVDAALDAMERTP